MAVTRPSTAFAMSDDLYSQGFRTCAPKTRHRTIKRNQKLWVESPLLGPYVLVEFSDRWPEVFKADGFKSMLMDETKGKPRLVPHADVMKIKSAEVRGCVSLRRGQKLLVDFGAFVGTPAIYDERVDEDRSSVLVGMLGKAVRTIVPTDSLDFA